MKKKTPYKNLKDCEMHNLRIEFDTYEEELEKHLHYYWALVKDCDDLDDVMYEMDTCEKYSHIKDEIRIIIHFKNQETLELNNNIFDFFTLSNFWAADEIHADYCGEVDVEGYEDMEEKYLVPMIEVQKKGNPDGCLHEFRFPLSSVCFVEQYEKKFSWRQKWQDLPKRDRVYRNNLFLKEKAESKKRRENEKKKNNK